MADSTTNLDEVQTGTNGKEVQFNDLQDACSNSALFGRHEGQSLGLSWAYYGGTFYTTTGVAVEIPNAVVELPASSTVYISCTRTGGAVVVATNNTEFNDAANYFKLYVVVTGTDEPTSWTDYRVDGLTGVAASKVLPAAAPVADADPFNATERNFNHTIDWHQIIGSPSYTYTYVWCKEWGLWVSCQDRNNPTNAYGYSVDGLNWTYTNGTNFNNKIAMAYSADKGIIALGCTSTAMGWSEDGKTWTETTMPSGLQSINRHGMAYSPELGIFVVVTSGGSNRAAYSTDGKTWTLSATSPNTGHLWRSVAWSPELGMFCAVGDNGYTSRSVDGMNWDASIKINTFRDMQQVIWSATHQAFCAVGAGASLQQFAYSTDGTTWLYNYPLGDTNDNWYSLVENPVAGRIDIGGGSSNTYRMAHTYDLVNWFATEENYGGACYELSYSRELNMWIGCITSGSNRFRWMGGESGEHVPLLIGGTNIASATTYTSRWMRRGNVVTLQGMVTVTPSVAATTTKVNVQTPMNVPNWATWASVAGSGNIGGYGGTPLAVRAEIAGGWDDIELVGVPVDTTARNWTFAATYTIR